MRHYPVRWCCVLVFAFLSGCGPAKPLSKPLPPPVVKVSVPIAKENAVNYEDFIGRTDAVSRVEIRARVSGYLVKVNFKDGDIVEEGKLLYEIDRHPFEAQLAQAKGEVERLEAQKKLLELQVDRYRKLAEKGAASQQDLDQYIAQLAENAGNLTTAKAKVEQADLNLEFTRVTSPITGQIGRTLLTVGNLVAADNTLLTTVVSLDPMYAYFDVEEITLLEIRKLIRQGVIDNNKSDKVPVHMGLADDVDRNFPMVGTIDFANNVVDPQTGTIELRGTFDNHFELPKPPLLAPGMFVRVRVAMGRPHTALLINERALGTDQDQKFVYVIDAQQKVKYREVKLGKTFDGLRAIVKGLEPGDHVVVDGIQRIRPGMEVREQMVDMRTLTAEVAKTASPATDE